MEGGHERGAVLAERIRERQRALGLKGVEIAAQAGIPRSYLSELSNATARSFPKAPLIRKLAKALRCSPSYLTGESADAPAPTPYDRNPDIRAIADALNDRPEVARHFAAAMRALLGAVVPEEDNVLEFVPARSEEKPKEMSDVELRDIAKALGDVIEFRKGALWKEYEVPLVATVSAGSGIENLVTSSSMARSEQMSKQLVAFFGARSPETIDMAAALEYRNKRIEDGVRFRSIWNELSFLKQLLTYGYENMSETGMGRLMLLRLPKLPKQESSGIALTKDEFFRILRVGHLERDGGRIVRIVTFGVITMLRRSVLLGLRWEWIDLEQRWLNVPASYMKGKQGMKRPLSVPLCDWAIELLGEPRKGGYVWPNVVTQRPLDNVFYSLERLSVAAQTREFSLHDLRRTGTSFLANAGVDRIIRKILLGHATDNEVTDLYTFIDKEKLRETVTFFDGLKREFLGKTWKVLKMQSGSNE
jgi:integrase